MEPYALVEPDVPIEPDTLLESNAPGEPEALMEPEVPNTPVEHNTLVESDTPGEPETQAKLDALPEHVKMEIQSLKVSSLAQSNPLSCLTVS